MLNTSSNHIALTILAAGDGIPLSRHGNTVHAKARVAIQDPPSTGCSIALSNEISNGHILFPIVETEPQSRHIPRAGGCRINLELVKKTPE
jgi:hypothetical protein